MPRLQLTQRRENYELGARLRTLRDRQGLKQIELANRVGITYQQIYKYESGKSSLTIPAMKRLAVGLGVDPCEICGCCENPVYAANREFIQHARSDQTNV